MLDRGTIILYIALSRGIDRIKCAETFKHPVKGTDINKEVVSLMLILTRKTGETILIGDDIEVTITSIDQNKVRVGIKSPAHIPIYREEIYRKIQKENRAAALIGKDEFESLLDIYASGRQGGGGTGSDSGKS